MTILRELILDAISAFLFLAVAAVAVTVAAFVVYALFWTLGIIPGAIMGGLCWGSGVC